MTNYDILKEYEAHQTPVPSYVEWERILVKNDSLEQIRDELDCAVTQLREDKIDLEEENAQLKELLKQAETQIIAYKNNDTLPERAFYEKEVEELLTKIDGVQDD